MTCKELRSLWEKYEADQCSDEEKKNIEAHLESCQDCSLFIERKLDEEEIPVIPTNNLEKADPLLMKKSMRKAKWKQRLNNTTFLIAVVIGVWLIGGMLSMMFYTDSNRRDIMVVEQLAIESLLPNVNVRSTGFNTKSFFRADIEMRLDKTVGKETVPVGKLTFAHAFKNIINTEREWINGQFDTKLYFVHPSASNYDDIHERYDQFWDVLEKLPEGTVSEVAISFNQTYSVEDINFLLSRYFLDHQQMPLWYALDVGYEVEEKHGPYLGVGEVVGFPKYMDYGHYYNDSNMSEADQVVEMMKRFSENENTVKKMGISFIDEWDFEDKYEYVKENGVQVYGVVLTGPTKELLKLKELEEITFATVGEVELWNWFDRPASGSMY